MFFSDDVKADYEPSKRVGPVRRTPTQVPDATIGKLNDTCGNVFKSPSWRAGRAGVPPGLAAP